MVPAGGGWPDHVQRVEQAGVDSLLIRDHLETGPFGPQLAPLAAAAVAAAYTTKLRVGTMGLATTTGTRRWSPTRRRRST